MLNQAVTSPARASWRRPPPPLPAAFYRRDVVVVARCLLGKLLIRRNRQGITAGRIVETEAYCGILDPASHSFRGRTARNAAMFGPAGRSYVYTIHTHFCFNVVTDDVDVAHAVLIRAVEPLQGLELMQQRRGLTRLLDLTRGPGRLCQAFAIDHGLNHWSLTRGQRLWIAEDPEFHGPHDIARSPRIGVGSARDLPLRFFFRGDRFVSGPRKLSVVRRASGGELKE